MFLANKTNHNKTVAVRNGPILFNVAQ